MFQRTLVINLHLLSVVGGNETMLTRVPKSGTRISASELAFARH